MTDIGRWQRLWSRVGAEALGAQVYQEIVGRYGERARVYHTLAHVSHCLAELDAALVNQEDLAEHPGEVELALWLHDVVYDPRAADNEERSAAWADDALERGGANEDVRQRVGALIAITRHDAAPATADERLVADVDLSILGQSEARFWLYERGIRAEYDWVPEALFRLRRAAILRRFSDRGRIYASDLFYARYEAPARGNLRRAISRLALPIAPAT